MFKIGDEAEVVGCPWERANGKTMKIDIVEEESCVLLDKEGELWRLSKEHLKPIKPKESETMFKVGDEVEVVNLDSFFVGAKGIVKSIARLSRNVTVKIYNKEDFVVFDSDYLKLIKPKQFTKDMLQDGMVVELEDYKGTHFIIFLGVLFNKTFDLIRLGEYNDDLTHNDYEKLSITKVYDNPQDMRVIWERESKPTDEERNKLYSEVNSLLYYYNTNGETKSLGKAKNIINDFIEQHYKNK